MSRKQVLRVEDLPPLTGRPGVAQGGYGQRGNLELVCPDPDTGFWVLWWNADPADARTGARPGAWSGGLHVPTGHRHSSTAITQLRRGPSFLEVVLAGPDGVHRTTWSPDGGFSPVSRVAAGAAASRLVEPPLGDALHLLVASPSSVLHVTGGAAAYPDLGWSGSPISAGQVPPTALSPDGAEGLVAVTAAGGGVVTARWGPATGWTEPVPLHLDTAATELEVLRLPGGDHLVLALGADGALQAARLHADGSATSAAAPPLRAESFAAAESTVDGGRVELVARTGATLVHIWRGADGSWADPVVVRSEAWVDPALTTVHRHA
jgi:hypothetical protein